MGSSTNLGVNASVSSTTGYAVDSNATLGLAGTTTLKQVIGTSGTANAASKTNTRAHTMNHDYCTSNCDEGSVMTGAMHDENSQLLDDPYKYENPIGKANGSSTLNFSTSSFANQSYSKTASGFIQAFRGNTAANANVNYSASGGGEAGGLNTLSIKEVNPLVLQENLR